MRSDQKISIVIPTYNRESVLLETIGYLLEQSSLLEDLIIVDQTKGHEIKTQNILKCLHNNGKINWIKLTEPSITYSMNIGACCSRGDIILFLDDDIVPDSDLLKCHLHGHNHPSTWAVAGQVLQPEDWQNNFFKKRLRHTMLCPRDSLNTESLKEDLNFKFNGHQESWVTNVMAGNLSVKRNKFFELGGFDENFRPPVAYRFETEFAKRIVANSGRIRFEPRASIKHLRSPSGGTRSKGSHLRSASPVHGVGDYYFALKCGKGFERFFYMGTRPLREVRTKYHLKHPWWIPVKLFGEFRAIFSAISLYHQGPRYIEERDFSCV